MRVAASLSRRLAAVLLLLFVPVGGLFAFAMFTVTRLHNQEVTQRFNRSLATHLASDRALMRGGQVDEEAAGEIFHMLMVVNPNIEIYLLDGEGRILSVSAPPGKVVRRQVSMEPLRRLLAGDDDLPILGDDPRDRSGRKVFSVAEIPGDGVPAGYLYVILGGEAYDSLSQLLSGSYILRLGLMVVAGGLLFALMAGLIFFHRLTRRLRSLTADMEAFRRGGFADAPPEPPAGVPPGGDEIDRLAGVFREMAERIQEQLAALREADRSRRELVAGVSHDLRTPLASLKGFLETLLMKEREVPPHEREDYLRTAMVNARELEARVEKLLEIARLDSPDLKLESEEFPLDELAEALVQKFRVAAEERGVAVEARYPEGLPFVRADIELVKRVLENLIENALRASREGGEVILELTHRAEGIEVSVADRGEGISAGDLPRIFERHFRGPGGRAGLGLAIAQRIVELHGSAIGVESREGEGSTFRFTLPAAK